MYRALIGLCLITGLLGCSDRQQRVESAAPLTEEAPLSTKAEIEPSTELATFFDRIEQQRRAASPQAMAAALMGTGREQRYLGLLDMPSVLSTEATLQRAREHREGLAEFKTEELNRSDQLSRNIIAWTLDHQIDGGAWLWHDYPVNQLMAIHNLLPGFMTGQHPLRHDADLDFYLQRLAQFPQAFAGTVDVVRHRVERGVLPPRFAIEKTLRDSRSFIAVAPAVNPLVSEIIAAAERSGTISTERRARLVDELGSAVAVHVYPAYQVLIDYLEQLLEHSDSNDGVWRLPDGDAYYRWLLRGHTTTDLGPDEIHQLGLDEVQRISTQMHELLCGEGYCEGSVGQRMAGLNAEARFLFDDNDAGREQILDNYRRIVSEIEAGLDGWFHEGPTAAIEVQRVPEYREASSFGAYYSRPAGDGSRPGVFYANLRNVEEHPRFGLRTLAYHEAIPGHHLQITRQQAMSDVPDFRRSMSLHAHAEGWALYAEKLAWEMGFHTDPFDNLGRLRAELFRAVRLVVDTGMHHRRWSRERGIEYMHQTTGMPMTDVVAEIERYLVIPGQACAFKIGMLRIEAMRERARLAFGNEFDVRDFHRLILDSGAMPLALLDSVVDDWIDAQAPASSE